MPALPARRTVLPIQALRGLAALSVAVFHIGGAAGFFVGQQGAAPYRWMRAVPWEAGVDVFFVISGFVIVYASAHLFGRRGALGEFVWRRLARVVPLYWAATAALIGVMLLTGIHLNTAALDGPAYVAASFLFLPAMRDDGLIVPVLSLGWTLNYEMAFYALVALTLPLPWRRAAWTAIAALVALACYGRIAQPAAPMLRFWTDGVILEFALGIVLALLRLGGVRLPAPFRAVLAVAALAALFWGSDQDRATSFGLCAFAVVGAAALGEDRVPRPLAALCVWLGDLSYALYLTHAFPMRAMRELWQRLPVGGDARILGYILSTIVVALIAATAVNAWFEKPVGRWLRRQARPAAQPA